VHGRANDECQMPHVAAHMTRPTELVTALQQQQPPSQQQMMRRVAKAPTLFTVV